MSRSLPGLGLKGFWPLHFTGWNDEMDVNLLALSALVGGSALSLVDADPSTPTDGDIHLLSGAHPTHPGTIAVRDAGAWFYITVPTGKIMYDVGTSKHRQFVGGAWAELVTASGGGGPAGGPDVGGVRFTAGVDLASGGLTVTDSPYVAVSFWVELPTTAARSSAMYYCCDPRGDALNLCAPSNGGPYDGKTVAVFGDSAASQYARAYGDNQIPLATWHHYLIVFKGVADGTTAQNFLKVYRNRVLETPALEHDSYAAPVTPNFNGKPFSVGSDAYHTVMDYNMADFWFQTGVDLLESDGTVSSATLDKFVTADLKPVDLGATGQLPTGSTPVIFLHRSKTGAATDFAVNLGTGGAFALDTPSNLTTSPTDPGA